MRRRDATPWTVLLTLAALSSACGASSESTPTPEPTAPQATATPPASTAAPTVAPTAQPTSEPTAAPTPEPTEAQPDPTDAPPTEAPIPEITEEPTAPPTPPPPPAKCAEGSKKMGEECVPDLSEGWNHIEGAEGTICSRGTPFSWYIRPGKVNKLVVGFDGGGACWDAVTCSEANPMFSEEVNDGDNPENLAQGAMNFEDDRNPVKDYFVIFIPYCTGDIHWGDTVKTYPPKATYPEVTINHKGFVNGTSVMNWIYEHFSRPEDILVTGISAGAYGSLLYAPYLMDHYKWSNVYQSGDSGAGVVTRDFMTNDEEGFNAWNAWDSFPPWLMETVTQPLNTMTFADAYIMAANYYPHQLFSQYNTAFDDVQIVFYVAMGGRPDDWAPQMEAFNQEITEAAPSYRYFTMGGSMHGILAYQEFYLYKADEEPVMEWYTDMVNGVPVESIHCQEGECEEPSMIQSARR